MILEKISNLDINSIGTSNQDQMKANEIRD